MASRHLKFAIPSRGQVSALLDVPQGELDLVVIYAPGAGSSLRDPFGAFLAAELPARGLALLRFQFPYAEAGRRAPDSTEVLEQTWRAVIGSSESMAGAICASGRSMGGRIASQVVAQGAPVGSLALFAYPLHPPGKPEQRRDAHLSDIRVPTLFCSGSRDSFAPPQELQDAAARVHKATTHFLEGADHGFSVAKASGRTRQDVWREATDALIAFLTGLQSGSAA
jgi:predicted alpha/beta-hydrolase family hydrolase